MYNKNIIKYVRQKNTINFKQIDSHKHSLQKDQTGLKCRPWKGLFCMKNTNKCLYEIKCIFKSRRNIVMITVKVHIRYMLLQHLYMISI